MKTIMKHFGLCVFSSAIIMTSCNSRREEPVAYNVVPEEQIEMRQMKMDSVEASFYRTLSEINENLLEISEKRGLGKGSPMEEGISVHESILRNIQTINTLVADNKKKIAWLNHELRKYKMENSSLAVKVGASADIMHGYEDQINAYKNTLSAKEYTVEELNKEVERLEVKSRNLQAESDYYLKNLRTAYYIIESREDLEEQGVVTEKGGVLGMGKTVALSENMPQENFTKIDIQQTTSIPILGKKPVLVSHHPAGSYEFRTSNNMTTFLHIQDPESFWKTSKYMVVAVR